MITKKTGRKPVSANGTTDAATEKRLRESYIKHATLAQLHRWFQYLENCECGLTNHIDTLSDDVIVRTESSTTTGLNAYLETVSPPPARPRKAHVLKDHSIEILADGSICLNADIDTLTDNHPAMNDALIQSFRCQAKLRPTNSTLPLFTELRSSNVGAESESEFKDALQEHRVRSLVHYFTAIVEDPSRNPEPFREVLADEFSINYTETPMTDFETVKGWVAGALSSVVASNHQIHDVSFEVTSHGDYLVTIAMQSRALFPDGSGITSKNSQTWTLVDELADRFPKIRKITIDRDEVRRI